MPTLVRLLSGSEGTAAKAAGALCFLADDNAANQYAIREAGGVAPLVTLLAAAADKEAARNASLALCLLTCANANCEVCDAILEAGGVAPLVALLAAGANNDAAKWAAGAPSR